MEEEEGTSRDLNAWGEFFSWDRICGGKKACLFTSSNLLASLPNPEFSFLSLLQEELSGNSELIQKYRNTITHAPNLENIVLYWNSYNK